MTQEQAIQEVRNRLANAKAVTVLTGAGISADSGIPTFRGAEGLWKNFRPEELASPEAFEKDPRIVWEWYNWRRELIASKAPNEAHHTLVELEQRTEQFWLITQNVDGLHPKAGSQRLSEIHGNIWKVCCTECSQVFDNLEVPLPALPLCQVCKGLLRPHIVWFGESLDPQDLQHSYAALQACDLLLIIGTSGMVYPAASFGPVAKDQGAFVVECNLDPTPNSTLVDLAIQGKAKDIVPQILP
jgi:NAD-dependent deacetylase